MEHLTVRDRLWVWGHEEGSHNETYGIQGMSRMTPAESAYYLGIRNALFVRFSDLPKPPFDQHALALRSLDRVTWSIIGAGGRTDAGELDTVLSLSERFPNIKSVIMDDFFRKTDDGGWQGVHSIAELQAMRTRLTTASSSLDNLPLWVVLYAHQLLPESARETIRAHLALTDVVTFWTWQSDELVHLERDFTIAEELAMGKRMMLGCYLYDYGNRTEMPVAGLQRQCEIGLEWLHAGRIDGIILLGNCVCDLDLPAVAWARKWISRVSDQSVIGRNSVEVAAPVSVIENPRENPRKF